MGRRYSEEEQEYWRRHVEGYESSGQTRETYRRLFGRGFSGWI